MLYLSRLIDISCWAMVPVCIRASFTPGSAADETCCSVTGCASVICSGIYCSAGSSCIYCPAGGSGTICPYCGGKDLFIFGRIVVSLASIEGPVFLSAILMVGSDEGSTFFTSILNSCCSGCILYISYRMSCRKGSDTGCGCGCMIRSSFPVTLYPSPITGVVSI